MIQRELLIIVLSKLETNYSTRIKQVSQSKDKVLIAINYQIKETAELKQKLKELQERIDKLSKSRKIDIK